LKILGCLVVFAIYLAANFGFGQQRYTVSDEDAAAPKAVILSEAPRRSIA